MPKRRKISAEAKTIGEILRRPVQYCVPANQRDFSWTQEEIDILWQDLTGAISEDRDEYFFGAIVVAPMDGDQTNLEIVDGQQRLATLSMILAAVRDSWGEKEQAQEIFDTYLGARNRRTRDVTPKLTLNALNAATFQRVVLDGESLSPAEKRTSRKSNLLLFRAYERLKSHLETWKNKQASADEALIEIEEYIDKQANVILIEVDDQSDAFTIFETLNDRGLELAVSDLVKNYLFSLAGAKIESFKSAWTEISQIVGTENLTSFLRHLWISEYRLLRERELYRSLRDEIKGPTKARSFLARLRKAADLYAALLSPDDPYWGSIPGSPQQHVRTLRLLRTAQFRPLALAVMEVGTDAEVASMLRIVLAVSYRHIVAERGANELERAYSNAAIKVRSTKKANARTIIELLKNVYISDADFEQRFKAFSFAKSDLARYTLTELNKALESDKASGANEDASLEHILPRNPGDQWKQIPKADEISDWVERIGNLTLLEKGTNKGLGNKDFRTKLSKGYAKSTLAINRELKSASTWTTKEIEMRSKNLAAKAVGIWKVQSS